MVVFDELTNMPREATVNI